MSPTITEEEANFLRALVARLDVVKPIEALNSASEATCLAVEYTPHASRCMNLPRSRGLCQKHYLGVRYYLSLKRVTEGWLVRHGRMLPALRLVHRDLLG